jgi:hypothetical protein
MKKTTFLLSFLLSIAFSLSAQTDTLNSNVLTPLQLQEDFNLYRHMIQETHPGLYRYTTKEVMQARLDSIAGMLNKPMPFYSFYKLLMVANASIKCAHSTILPTATFWNYFSTQPKTFPFFLQPIDGKYIVLFNGTNNQLIKPGYQLTEINGQPIEKIAMIIKQYYWSDGNIQLSGNIPLQGGLFCFFYYALIERPERFNLTFKDLNGKNVQVSEAAQIFSKTNKNFRRNPLNKPMLELYGQGHKKPWRLNFPEGLEQTAMLRFDSFGGKGIKNEVEAKIAFRRFMDKALAKMNKKEIKKLIIDVRANGGGWDIQGCELFTYLMKSDSAVKYYQKQHTITDSSDYLKYSDLSAETLKKVQAELIKEAVGTFTLSAEKNQLLRLQQPKTNRFRGKVYVLMNERSLSTTSEFLAVAKYNNIGTFVGEESGGVYEGGNGGRFIQMTLPHSKIQISSPLVYYQNAVGPAILQGRGTIPDHQITFNPDDLLTGYDRQLEYIKTLIKSKVQ